MAWRYVAFAEPSGAFLGEVTLVGAEVSRVLSGPGRLTGLIKAGLVPPWLLPWHCSIYAEDESGTIRGGGFVTPLDQSSDGVKVDCVGRSGYPKGMPWVGDPVSLVQADPLAIVRQIWAHLQSQPGGDVGMNVDATTSPVRVGEPERDVSFTTGNGQDVTFASGPFTLDWWSTVDLGGEIDKLAIATPFDYLEHASWDTSGERLGHRLELGYPAIGTRREGLRLALGENVILTPSLSSGDEDYASEVHALGAGEGRSMVRAALTRASSGVRRVLTYADKTARSQSDLTSAARADLSWRDGTGALAELSVIEHPHAPLAALIPGVEIFVSGADGDLILDRWVRIVEVTMQPESDIARLRVVEV